MPGGIVELSCQLRCRYSNVITLLFSSKIIIVTHFSFFIITEMTLNNYQTFLTIVKIFSFNLLYLCSLTRSVCGLKHKQNSKVQNWNSTISHSFTQFQRVAYTPFLCVLFPFNLFIHSFIAYSSLFNQKAINFGMNTLK